MKYEDLENFNFLLSFIFSLYVTISILGGTGSAPKMHCNMEEDFERGKKFSDKTPTRFKPLFLGLFFAVESKSGIEKLVNLLLLEIIGP